MIVNNTKRVISLSSAVISYDEYSNHSNKYRNIRSTAANDGGTRIVIKNKACEATYQNAAAILIAKFFLLLK